jgi:type I restriction enzyme S subunit
MKTRTLQLGDVEMRQTTSIALGEIMPAKSGSVDPADFPNEVFDLYSIPAFDTGQPEVLTGREIGSTKQVIQPGDVLLSKIVPHIRRAWVVGKDRGRRLIASSEWIVFRSDKAHPDYLRHVLVGDQFHVRFMQTVSGVGGSLLRARPGYVAEIEIPLPPLSEQQRIAGVLEQADRLRRTRRYALELSDSFLPAAFRQLFGDPAKKTQWPFVPFGELISTGPQNGLYKHAATYGSGTPIVRIDAYQSGEVVNFTELKRVRLSPEEVKTFGLVAGDFLINRVNSRSHLGKSMLVPQLAEPTVFESNMMRFRLKESTIVAAYALKFLQTPFLNAQIQKQAKDASNQSSINQEDVEGFAILLPPLALQQQFASLVTRHERLRAVQREALRQAEHLFQSLLHRAFTTGL